MDFVPIVNGVVSNAAAAGGAASEQFGPLLDFIKNNFVAMISFGILMVVVYGFLRRIWKRLSRTVEDTMFSNWRLALLAATALVLSLASGWTTWDGMKNFTGEPTLSLMITFGIQGVMLIVAWLIGETFATGMHQRPADRAMHMAGIVGGIIAATIVVGSVGALIFLNSVPVSREVMLFGTVGVGVVALIAFLQWDLFQPYLQSSRIIMRNAVLWVMFLACMATSVFFSFDSLFSTIFPADERARAAQLRAQNQVAGVVADIGQTITTRRAQEVERLFDRENEGWSKYEEQLDELAAESQGAQQLIEDHFVKQMEARRGAIAEQQDRIAAAESSKAALEAKRAGLAAELTRLQGERPSAAAAVAQQAAVVAQLEKKLDEQRALTLAEERGVEGSGKEGRGKFWRASKDLERRIEAEIEVARRRLSSPQGRLEEINKRTAEIQAVLAQVDGDIAKHKGVAETASRRISVTSQTGGEDEPQVDPARVLPAFERAQAAFRQDPTAERLNALHAQCTQLLGAMLSTPATKEKVRGIDCDPKQASEAAAVVFALNVGVKAFSQNCAGGAKLESIPSTDGLFGFARQCLADSGLPSAATDKLRTKINLAELNRDDKAHRFVVTWNAFQDGNRLAYLALAIAIAIDALVFMSGLFGANAVRSPLQDVPSLKPRSAQQLESIIENALLPDKFANAHAVIEAMQPITPVDGFTQEVIVPFEETPDRPRVLKVLNAGSAIGAVARDPNRPERYFVRPELFEFLSFTAKTCFEKEKDLARVAELREVITVSLQPHVSEHADIVLNNMHPINEVNGFSSEVVLEQVPETELPIVRRVLNAGTTLNYAQRDDKERTTSRYYIHKQLYKTIALISATVPKSGGRIGTQAQITGPEAGRVQYGGDLTQRTRALGHQPAGEPDVPDAAGDAPPPVPGSDGVNPAQLERYYGDELFDVLDIKRDEDRVSLLTADDAHKAADEAWRALLHHASGNWTLRDYVQQFEQSLLDGLKARYESFKSAVGRQSVEAAALDRVRTRIDAAWPLLMLHPEAGLVQSLIEKLDQAASDDGTLSPEDEDLRNRLNNALTMIRASKLGEASTWQGVTNAIVEVAPFGDDGDLPNVARSGSPLENIIPINKKPSGTNG